MRIAESELIINDDGSAFHIHLKPEELADIVILVGDPGRVDMVAGFLTDIEFRHQSREFVSTTGKYNGKRVTVLSTGIGTDNIDIVMTELDALANVDFTTREPKKEHRTLTILRIGTCGAVQADIPLGSAIFSHYSVGCDGLMNWYEGRDELSNLEMEKAFKDTRIGTRILPSAIFREGQAEKLIKKFDDCSVKGMTISASGFYGPQGRVVRQGLAMPDMLGGLRVLPLRGISDHQFRDGKLGGRRNGQTSRTRGRHDMLRHRQPLPQEQQPGLQTTGARPRGTRPEQTLRIEETGISLHTAS